MEHGLAFGTKEWAPYNFNFMNGCSNDCAYCYAKDMAIRFKRKTPESWKVEEPVKMGKKSFGKRKGPIMVPSSHDITPGNIDLAVEVFGKLLASGNELLVVTKPNLECIKLICDTFAGENIRFRFTIGSVDDAVLKLWEPGAPCFADRLESLRYAFGKGFSTSISCEPLLDEKFDDLYRQVEPYVTDSIWVGKMNMARKRVRDNTEGCFPMGAVEKLIESQRDEKIIGLYRKYKDCPKIQWKESIKKVVLTHNLASTEDLQHQTMSVVGVGLYQSVRLCEA